MLKTITLLLTVVFLSACNQYKYESICAESCGKNDMIFHTYDKTKRICSCTSTKAEHIKAKIPQLKVSYHCDDVVCRQPVTWQGVVCIWGGPINRCFKYDYGKHVFKFIGKYELPKKERFEVKDFSKDLKKKRKAKKKSK